LTTKEDNYYGIQDKRHLAEAIARTYSNSSLGVLLVNPIW